MLNSVEYIPLAKANAAFITDSSKVFREQREISPRHISDNIEYIPWGGDDMMPYDIMELFEDSGDLQYLQLGSMLRRRSAIRHYGMRPQYEAAHRRLLRN